MNDQAQMMNQSYMMNQSQMMNQPPQKMMTMEEYLGLGNLPPPRVPPMEVYLGLGIGNLPIPPRRERPPLPSWLPPPRLEEDDSWLDEEIQKEDDERMKMVMIRVKRTMRKLTNETKREYISDERNRIVEMEHYAYDIKTTEGFEVRDYPYLARAVLGGFITRYYYPPDITITDFELDQLTHLANLAIALYNDHQQIHGVQQNYGNVIVIKAMRSFSLGFTYYLTFQASFVGHPHPPQIFEAKVYVDENHKNDFQFVRRARSCLQQSN